MHFGGQVIEMRNTYPDLSKIRFENTCGPRFVKQDFKNLFLETWCWFFFFRCKYLNSISIKLSPEWVHNRDFSAVLYKNPHENVSEMNHSHHHDILLCCDFNSSIFFTLCIFWLISLICSLYSPIDVKVTLQFGSLTHSAQTKTPNHWKGLTLIFYIIIIK